MKRLKFIRNFIRIQNNDKVDSNKIEHADRKYSLYILNEEINSFIDLIATSTLLIIILGILALSVWAVFKIGFFTYESAYPVFGNWSILIGIFMSFWLSRVFMLILC